MIFQEGKPPKQGHIKTKTYGVLVDALLEDAFAILQHDTGEADVEWHETRGWLAEKFIKTLKKKNK